jgi:hypothetical protein
MTIMSLSSKAIFYVVTIMIIVSLLEGASAEMTENPVHLPKTLEVWTRPDSAQIVDSSNIFDYMNGAGELYLAYRFDHLEVYEYTADQQDDILVEVYVMNTSNDAFGLLSLDWEGEPVTFSSSPTRHTNSTIASPARALYGGGLLRMCADTIYARVMAYQETPESREAVLALGQAIAANRKPPAEPGLLKILPQTIGSDWTLRNDRIGYFRSHLVLNSLYYLSHQNILDLDHSTEAVTAPYENVTDPSQRIQILCVKYATPGQTQQTLDHFHDAYLPEHPKGFDAGGVTTKHSNVFNIEDGWLGYTLDETGLAIVFECPDRETAQMIIEQISVP